MKSAQNYVGGRSYSQRWNSSGDGITLNRNPDGSLRETVRDFGFGNIQSRTHYTYNADGSVARIRHEDAAGELIHPSADLTYTRDPGGRLATAARPGNVATVSYDFAGRLAAVVNTDPAVPDETYTYDLGGNRATSHLMAGMTTVSAGNRLTSSGSFTYTYDLDGNLATRTDTDSGEVTTYTYDHRNRLVSAESPSTSVSFAYDFLNRLISRTIDGTKTWIINDRYMPIGEFADGATEMSRTYFYSLDRPDEFHAVKDRR